MGIHRLEGRPAQPHGLRRLMVDPAPQAAHLCEEGATGEEDVDAGVDVNYPRVWG